MKDQRCAVISKPSLNFAATAEKRHCRYLIISVNKKDWHDLHDLHDLYDFDGQFLSQKSFVVAISPSMATAAPVWV
jgi:hypothetical protein